MKIVATLTDEDVKAILKTEMEKRFGKKVTAVTTSYMSNITVEFSDELPEPPKFTGLNLTYPPGARVGTALSDTTSNQETVKTHAAQIQEMFAPQPNE